AGACAEEVLQFAHHLFSRHEYFRAITEYQRFLFLYPENPEGATAALRIAQCYFRGRRWDQVVEVVDSFFRDYEQSPLKWEARLLKGRALIHLGCGEKGREEFQAVIKARPGSSLEAEAWYGIGLSYGREGRWLEADQALRQIGTESRFYGTAAQVQQILKEASKRRRKDPALAGLLAAIVPGAGHLYCKRPADAAVAFGFTGAFAGATVEAFSQDHEELAIGLAVVTLAFYGGNIFSAVNVAHKFNDREKRRLDESLAPFEDIGLGRKRAPSVSLAVQVFF
ncbi:MAG: tetratricopeptide repeat protein, partial [Syntrophobacteria bacterium]